MCGFSPHELLDAFPNPMHDVLIQQDCGSGFSHTNVNPTNPSAEEFSVLVIVHLSRGRPTRLSKPNINGKVDIDGNRR